MTLFRPVSPLKLLIFVATFVAGLTSLTPAFSAVFRESIQRDFRLRSLSKLQVTNLRGGIKIQGWALEKIRVKAVRQVEARDAEEAKRIFQALDFRYRDLGKEIELSAEYGRGLELQERLKERLNPTTRMEIVVYAPARLPLSVWANEGEIGVKDWKNSVDLRTTRGEVKLESLKAPVVGILCPSCSIDARDIQGTSFRCMGGSGLISLHNYEGDQVFIESTSGGIDLKQVHAEEQLFVTKEGNVRGRDLRGHVEFQSKKGQVQLTDGFGFVSGHTDTGDISVQMRTWEFFDKALLESSKGQVTLTLPRSFAGEVDLKSMLGKSFVEFPVRKLDDPFLYGPEPLNQIRGRVGDGGEQLRLYSHDGDVRLLRGGG